jgi:Matrixin
MSSWFDGLTTSGIPLIRRLSEIPFIRRLSEIPLIRRLSEIPFIPRLSEIPLILSLSKDERRRAVAMLLTGLCILSHLQPAFAYVKFGVRVGGQTVTLKWAQTPARYFVTDASVPGVTATDLQGALGRAFASWQGVPTSAISYQLGGFTNARPGDEDGLSTIGFRNRPDLDRVLGSTSFLVDNTTGALLESDIFFNASFAWSVASNGEAGKFDLESIALHEIGHFSGLGHSAIGETELRPDGGRRVLAAEAVMFPIAYSAGTVTGRTLRPDDIAGISDIYPDGGFATATGSLSGRVTKNGQGLFGAHIVAFDPGDGTMVGNFALNAQGEFSMAGLRPGPHVVRVEPIDDADLDSFFDPNRNVDIDFRVTYFDGLVIVPRGADSGSIEIKVVQK